jgi:hypothetical protein
MRAVQYMLAMRGIETKHGEFGGNSGRVEFDKAPDGSRRVRQVLLGGEWLTVPHWDFVA